MLSYASITCKYYVFVPHHKSYHQNIIGITTGSLSNAETSDRVPELTVVTNWETLIPQRHSLTNGTLAQMHLETAVTLTGRSQGKRLDWAYILENQERNFRTISQTIIQNFRLKSEQ